MPRNLQEIILPQLHSYFSQPILKDHLRQVAWWGNSFETWLKWEMVFALDPLMQRVQGRPFAYEVDGNNDGGWTMEKKVPGLGQVDLYFGGEEPLAVHLKVWAPCGYRGKRGQWTGLSKFGSGTNSLLDDIRKVSAFRTHGAACLLFVFEHAGAEAQFEATGLPPPAGVFSPAIDLGNTWCWHCLNKDDDAPQQRILANFYFWTNRR